MADWQGLELRHLVTLVAVAEEGTFSKAAQRLGYTQSAVSQHIAALERVVGGSLFDRPGGPRPVQPTAAGDALVAHARDLLGRVRAVEADVHAILAGEGGALRVGTVQSVGARILPDVVRRFTAARPGVEVRLRESHDPAALLALVVEGELDVTFCELPIPDWPLETRHILDDPYILLAPAGSAEADQPSISMPEVARLPLIGYRNASCLGLSVTYFDASTGPPQFVFHSDDNQTIQGCVAAGLGYAFTPLLTVDPDDAATVVLPIAPAVPPRRLGLAWHALRHPPPSLLAFADAVDDVCATLGFETVGS